MEVEVGCEKESRNSSAKWRPAVAATEIAAERHRFSYRRLGIMLAREGIVMNHRSCCGSTERRTCGSGAGAAANERWGRGRPCGRRIRILAIVDDFARECLALVVDTSPSGARVAMRDHMRTELPLAALMVAQPQSAHLGSAPFAALSQGHPFL